VLKQHSSEGAGLVCVWARRYGAYGVVVLGCMRVQACATVSRHLHKVAMRGGGTRIRGGVR
jgi:hypothetical protein